MTIFTGGKSSAINSPRHLTLRHARRAVALSKRALGTLSPNDEIPDSDLGPGEEQLYSYWAPGLDAGPTYRVEVSQVVKDPTSSDSLNLKGDQIFTVDAPQFVLPAGSIHSIYPPTGYSEEHRILPHIVLTDPHLPWERLAGPAPPKDPRPRNRVPWLALLSFTQDELTLDPGASDSIFSKTSVGKQQIVKQTDTLAVNMPVSDALVADVASPFLNQEISDSTKALRADFIFLPSDLFTSLFSSFDENGNRHVLENPDTSQYQYMSHVRNINTSGMALAGIEDNGIFSIVISRRCGILDNSVPTTMAVHLVSLEQVENMTFPISKSHVALCSLHSWNYTVLPENNLNIYDAFTNIGRSLGVLRPPEDIIKPFNDEASTSLLSQRIAQRMTDGYSLIKYRTQTGELTTALFRGPFTPNIVKPIPEFNKCSNSGVDLQILDKELGLMDITYSSAWQLGRTLALADQPFTAALCRLRTAIQAKAMKMAKVDIVSDHSTSKFRIREKLLQSLPSTVERLSQIHITSSQSVDSPFQAGGPLKRWHRPALRISQLPKLAFSSPLISEKYQSHAVKAARELAMATDGEIYDETNDAVSSDWMIVLGWILDRMFLAGVPAHYLVTDPQHLPEERLRFFYIDSNWVDSMIDGALSLGNHMGTDRDRAAIKTMVNDYIVATPRLQSHASQIPTYGFFLRSDVVSRFPDLRVSTISDESHTPVRAPLLRHNIIADGVMLGLFDRVPNSKEFQGLVFTQPPHQQRFCAAASVDKVNIKIEIRRQYTVPIEIRDKDNQRHDPLPLTDLPSKYNDKNNVFTWGSMPDLKDLHILRLPRFPELQLSSLINRMGSYTDQDIKYFDDDAATSALFAMQLNDPVYQLIIRFSDSEAATALAALSDPGLGSNTPRTLRSLAPSMVLNMSNETVEEDEGDQTPIPDHATLIENVNWDSAQQTPQLQAPLDFNMAPHVPFLPTLSHTDTTMNVGSVVLSDGPAHYPDFICRAYNPNVNGHANIYSGTGIPEDIIFSIHIQSTKGSDLSLTQFELRIQMDVVGSDIPNCLIAKYAGQGATMLNNLRFNVLTMPLTVDGVNYLSLRVLPRAEAGLIPVTKIGIHDDQDSQEISFILGSVLPNEFHSRVTSIYIKTFASYDKVVDAKEGKFSVTLINTTIPAEGGTVF